MRRRISEAKGSKLEIRFFESLPSTHTYLIDALKEGSLRAPVAVVAKEQSCGVGSRGSSWMGGEGNLFLSFALPRERLPEDLPLPSISIYFSWLMREVLAEAGSKIWLKWPNDFFLGAKKAGGTITHIAGGGSVVCSIGLNLKTAPKMCAVLDIEIDSETLLYAYFSKLKSPLFWKDVFRKYRVEFEKSKLFSVHDMETRRRVSLENAVLLEDGSVQIGNRRVYNQR